MTNLLKLKLKKASLFSFYTSQRTNEDKISFTIIGVQCLLASAVILYHII